MNTWLDELTKRLSGGASRRQTLQGLGALMLGAVGIDRASQASEARRNNNRRCNNCKQKCRRKNRRKNNNNNKQNCNNKCRNKCRNN